MKPMNLATGLAGGLAWVALAAFAREPGAVGAMIVFDSEPAAPAATAAYRDPNIQSHNLRQALALANSGQLAVAVAVSHPQDHGPAVMVMSKQHLTPFYLAYNSYQEARAVAAQLRVRIQSGGYGMGREGAVGEG